MRIAIMVRARTTVAWFLVCAQYDVLSLPDTQLPEPPLLGQRCGLAWHAMCRDLVVPSGVGDVRQYLCGRRRPEALP